MKITLNDGFGSFVVDTKPDTAFVQGAAAFNERGLAAMNPFDNDTELQAWLEWNAGWRAAQSIWCEQYAH